ncbi:MAG TPA: UDP-N-acetylglucosamine 2-epimerase (non-hydrolyzing) [Anaerolineales bacterium]|nr:UDP-N-acetylglucosamine 2-epimerase (non-hydrolyzing) [Anaerolineales bacterium]
MTESQLFKIHLIVAARPNYMKIAPLYHALKTEDWIQPVLIHTGQHYDYNMSEAFFNDLGLPEPDVFLNVGSGTHAEQTSKVMLGYEKVCMEAPPDLVVVVGDVNSTMAVAITAKKLHLQVAHLEAGLRSSDRRMPEEINRIVTDALSDILWTPSPDGDEHLHGEGIPAEKIVRVGNIMMDSYEMMRPKIEANTILDDMGLAARSYGVVTMHRPSNVDHKEKLTAITATMAEICAELPLVFPLHPRTKKQLEAFGLYEKFADTPGLHLVEPLGYLPFMKLVSSARLVITDSGGIQEETTYLNIPCLTLRDNTERPVTLTEGTNKLVNADTLMENFHKAMRGDWPDGVKPDLWDGKTALRIRDTLIERYKN